MTAAIPLILSTLAFQPAPQKAQMVEDVFKNVQVMNGIPVNQFMDDTILGRRETWQGPATISGDPVLAGFALQISEIW